MTRFELHTHTSECDRDAHIGARELVRLYKEAGYGGMVVTDHYIERFYTLWFPDDVRGLTHEQQVTRWLRGFRTARDEGEKIGFTVLPGAEVRFDGFPNDYLLYGLHEEFFYTVPRLNELKNVKELLALMPEGVCVVQAHPFRDDMVVANPAGLFGIEAFNGGTEKFRNSMARQFAEHYSMPMTSGSDIHDMTRLAKGGIETEHEIKTPEDLVKVLRSGEYKLIENY